MYAVFLAIDTYIIIGASIALVLIIYFGISYLIYRMMMINHNKHEINLVDHKEDFYKDSYAWFQEVPKEDIYVNSYDGFKLHAYYIPSYNKKSNSLAIVVHGYQSKSTDMIIIAKMYSEMGFQVIMPDLRSHGESEGYFTSFGHYEKYDLKKWINLALRSYGSNIELLIHGVSMGAATTLLVTGLDIPKKNIKFMVLDSIFTRVGKTLTNTNKSKGLRIFYFGINVITYFKYKFTFIGIRPIKQMRKNTFPFLIIQGKDDHVVPVSMAKQMLTVSPATKKELLIIDDAKHAQGFRVDFQKCYDSLKEEIRPIFNIKKIYNSRTKD